jgi:hypothetical protein
MRYEWMRRTEFHEGVESQISTPAKRTPRFDREEFFGAGKYFSLAVFFWEIDYPN